jgi:hypothetical protein
VKRTATGRAIKPTRKRPHGFNLMMSDEERAALAELTRTLETSTRDAIMRSIRYYIASRPFERNGVQW